MKEDRHFFDDSDAIPGPDEAEIMLGSVLGAFVLIAVAVGVCLIGWSILLGSA